MVFITSHHEISRAGVDLRVNRFSVFKNLSYFHHSSLLPLKYIHCPQIHSSEVHNIVAAANGTLCFLIHIEPENEIPNPEICSSF